jgi:hypothetical protein
MFLLPILAVWITGLSFGLYSFMVALCSLLSVGRGNALDLLEIVAQRRSEGEYKCLS